MMLLLFSSSSFFLKREEEDKEEEETLEIIALPLRFVRVRALAVVALVVGGIDDDDNIFILVTLFCFCVSFWQEREKISFV